MRVEGGKVEMGESLDGTWGAESAAWVVKRGGDVNIGGDKLRKDGLFFAARVGIQRFV